MRQLEKEEQTIVEKAMTDYSEVVYGKRFLEYSYNRLC